MENDALVSELDEIIRARRLTALFQPIADLRQRNIHGYEALSRGPSDSGLHSPLSLFDVAGRCGRLFELELLCREIAIARFQSLGLGGKLFLNATPESLLQPDHRPGRTLKALRRVGLAPERVVIELTEQHPLEDYEVMRQATEHYRAMGFQIAIDDLGAGYAGLRMWSELRPDYVKVDRHFIQGIHEDPVKREFVRSILDIAHGLDCRVIAEGIETEPEYAAVQRLGINLGQGYYFARPHQSPPCKLSAALFRRASGSCCSAAARLGENAGSLALPLPLLRETASLGQAQALFAASPEVQVVALVDEASRPVALLRRTQIAQAVAAGAESLRACAEEAPVIVDRRMSLETVSRLLTAEGGVTLTGEFLITEEARLLGMGRLVDLLQRITDQQVRAARYAHPVTQLPGNVPTYETLEQRLHAGTSFAVAYCDVDGFKPYNDVYGYAKGDRVLQSLAGILCRHISAGTDFVGHLGEDDFVLVFTGEGWRQRCESLLREFRVAVQSHYSETHAQQGGMWIRDRAGNERFHPQLSLSLGVVRPDPVRCQSYHDVIALAREASLEAKRRGGDQLFVDRRMAPTVSSTADIATEWRA